MSRSNASTIAPLAAAGGKKKGNTWKPVVAVDDLLIVSGGFNPKSEIAKSIRYTIDGTSFNYVELDKNAQWFLKGVGGPKTSKGDLKAVQVMAEIRQKWVDTTAVADLAKRDADVAAGAEDSGDDDDPMNALSSLDPTQGKTEKARFCSDTFYGVRT